MGPLRQILERCTRRRHFAQRSARRALPSPSSADHDPHRARTLKSPPEGAHAQAGEQGLLQGCVLFLPLVSVLAFHGL